MNNYEEKINSIKKAEKYLLEMARDEINRQNDLLSFNIQDLVKMIGYSEENIKKYEATLKAQVLISDLTNQIAKCNDIDEIKAIRNKLNYYINKVKTIIKERNISEEEYNKYYENATNLRKSISTYIRFLKREDNINEIEALYNKKDLSLEEEALLKKKIKLETSYGKRNSNNKPDVNENKKEKKKSNDNDELNRLLKSLSKDTESKKINNKSDIEELLKHLGKKEEKNVSLNVDALKRSVSNSKISIDEYHSVDDLLSNRTKLFDSRYQIKKNNRYDGGLLHNIGNFIKNVPNFIYNKGRIKMMERDCGIYDRSPEFIGFIEYTRHCNSIKRNISKVFKNSSICKNEHYYYDEQNRIIDWIKNFCNHNNLEISYMQKRYN